MSSIHNELMKVARGELSLYLAKTFAALSEVRGVHYGTLTTQNGRVGQLVLLVTDEVAVQLEDDIRRLERAGRKPTSHLLLLGLEDEAFLTQVGNALGSYANRARLLLERGQVDVAIARTTGWFREETRIIARTQSVQGGNVSSSDFWRVVRRVAKFYNPESGTFEE